MMCSATDTDNLGSKGGKNIKKEPFPWTAAFYLKAVPGLRVLQQVLAGLVWERQQARQPSSRKSSFISGSARVNSSYGEY